MNNLAQVRRQLKRKYLRTFNIKKLSDLYSGLYDYLYMEAERIFEETAVCVGVKNNTCAVGYPNNTRCCGQCQHHNKINGCTVRSLGCKLFMCDYIYKHTPLIAEQIVALQKTATESGLRYPLYYTKEESVRATITQFTKKISCFNNLNVIKATTTNTLA